MKFRSVTFHSCLFLRISPIDLPKKKFSSNRLPRHRSLRMQIQTLLQNKECLETFSSDLHSKLSTYIASLSAKMWQSYEISFWPRFHEFRLKEAMPIWEHHLKTIVPDLDHILIQKATLEYALVLLKDAVMICELKTNNNRSCMLYSIIL